MGENAGNNLYTYVHNSITNTVDYIGLKQITCTVIIVWGHGSNVEEYIENNYKKFDPETTALGPFGCKVNPAPSGYNIPGFPNLQNSFLGDKNRGDVANEMNNAGLNPNKGRTSADRRQGFANALRKALNAAQEEAKNICNNSCCKSVDVIFKGIGVRSNEGGTKVLKRRLAGTDFQLKNISSNMRKTIPCTKKRR